MFLFAVVFALVTSLEFAYIMYYSYLEGIVDPDHVFITIDLPLGMRNLDLEIVCFSKHITVILQFTFDEIM